MLVDELEGTPQQPKSKCPTCKAEGQLVGIGSASGRMYFRCPNSHEWQGKNPAAVALGSLGGKARAASQTPEQRRELAEKAANAAAEAVRKKRRESRG